MRMRCQHQVYFEPKMFETIGFHHQGNYNITAQVYSIDDQHSSRDKNKNYAMLTDLFEDYQTDRVNTDKLDYQTKKFDISYNEQEFIFNGGCKFKIQTDIASIRNTNQLLYLELKLVKYNGAMARYNGAMARCSSSKEGKAMFSTENMIKTTLDDEKDASHDKIQDGNKQGNKQKQCKQKPVETVSTVTLQIDPGTQNVCEPCSIFQTIVFPEQPYFGKLFFMINHVKIGYKVRNNDIKLPTFAAFSRSSTQSNTRDSVSLKLKLNHKGKQQIQHRESYEENNSDQQQILTIFDKVFHSPCVMFEHVVRQQIVHLNRMTQIEAELTGLEDRQTDTTAMNHKKKYILEQFQQTLSKRYNTSQSKSKQTPSILINVPAKDALCFESDLLQYYQCEGQQDLIKVIYEQGYNLSTLIASKWQDVILLMGRQKWCALYYHKTLTNFKSEISHLSKQLITDGLDKFSDQQSTASSSRSTTPSILKYKFYIHNSLPCMFTHKSTNNSLASLSKMSSEHILFVLVHGFNGNEQDMSRAKSFISYFCTPHFLVLKKISQKILENIQEIGRVAAEQIKQFLKTKPFIRRINFVGFSLGGVIIRAALPFLKQQQSMFNLLLTLSSPHLGVKQVKSCIVKTGMHVLHKIRGAKNIHQLLLGRANKSSPTEEQQLQQISTQISYMQRLAKDQTIKAFNLVVFCGSPEDKYVPGFSAMLDYQGEGNEINNMQKDLKENIRNLHQICVKFGHNKRGSSWDRIIGRRIHINFLDDDSFLYFLLAQYFHIF